MKELSYQTHYTSGGIEEITYLDDSTNFRWTRSVFSVPDGLNYLDKKSEENGVETITFEYFNGLIFTIERYRNEIGIVEKFTLSNPTDSEIEIDDDYSLKIGFADDYDIPAVALPRRAYTRVFDGGNCFCVYNSRMNGDSDGVGLVLTQGEFSKITRRKLTKKSVSEITCRFARVTLAKNEILTFSWLIFGYETLDEFVRVVGEYMPFFTLAKYPIFRGECISASSNGVLTVDGENVVGENDADANNVKITFDKAKFIKVCQNEDKRTEYLLKPLTSREYADKVFALYSYKSKSRRLLEKITDGDDSVESIARYLEKSKRTFDMGVPYDIIEKNDRLKELALSKVKYALKEQKGVFTPYKLLAKYEFLSFAQKMTDEIQVKCALDELKPLVSAFLRLNIELNL